MTNTPIQISGSAPRPSACEYCARPNQGLDLILVGRHPRLRGTTWLKSRQLGKLRVCRHCDRLWSEHFDSREGYVWYRDLGQGSLDILAEDSHVRRIIRWLAVDSPKDAYFWALEVLKECLRRHPDQLQSTLNTVLEALATLPSAPTELAAERRYAVLKMALLAVEQAAAFGPESGQSKTGTHRHESELVRSPEPALVRRQCQLHDPRPVGRAYLGKSPGLMWELARQSLWRRGTDPTGCRLYCPDVGPLLGAAFAELLADEERGIQRGYRRRNAFKDLFRLREIALRSDHSHCLAMPGDQWQALDQALDPVARMAQAADELLVALKMPTEQRLTLIQEHRQYMTLLSEHGARLDTETTALLERCLESLQQSAEHPDQIAYSDLYLLLKTTEQQARMDCTATTGECSF